MEFGTNDKLVSELSIVCKSDVLKDERQIEQRATADGGSHRAIPRTARLGCSCSTGDNSLPFVVIGHFHQYFWLDPAITSAAVSLPLWVGCQCAAISRWIVARQFVTDTRRLVEVLSWA